MVRRRSVAALLVVGVLLAAGAARVLGHRPDPDVEEGVRLAVVRLLTDDAGLVRVPPLLADRDVAVHDPGRAAVVAADVRRTWDDTQYQARLAQVEATLGRWAQTETPDTYDDNRFVVTAWQSLVVDGDHAGVAVLGHPEYRSGVQPWRAVPDGIWRVELVRVEGVGTYTRGWRLLEVTAPVQV